jgi:hypothetical protein
MSTGIDHCRTDPTELSRAEKPMATGVAAVRRKSKPALQHNHGPGLDPLARNMLEVEVPAPGAVSVTLKNSRDTPTVESAVASVAAPRSQTDYAGYEIG